MNQYVKGECIFTRINKNIKQYPYLTENIDADVIIVGGGVTGAILSYYFSQKDINTVILEKSRVAHGSTSITTSLLQYELETTYLRLKDKFNLSNIEKAYKLGIIALKELENFIDIFGNECDYRKNDSLFYTDKDLEIKEFQQEYEFRKNIGLDVELINKGDIPFGFPIETAVISKGGGAQLDPYKYTHHLLEVSSQNGSKIFENSEVISVNYMDDGVEVETIFGHKVKGKIVIVATGYNTKLFTNRNFGVKTTTFNIVTKPIYNMSEIYKPFLYRDSNTPYNYFRLTKDNRIILGGEDINFIPDIDKDNLCEKAYENLELRLKKMFSKYNIEIDYKYCGAFASTKDNLGFLGMDPKHKNLWYCLGYGSNGILYAILGGIMLSKLYLGNYSKELELFKVDRFDK